MPDESITLVFDPLALPTVQHRAGLAGLVVVSDLMKRSRIEAPAPELGSDGRWRVTLTRGTLLSLMNYVYDATLVEQAFAQKLKKGKGAGRMDLPPKRIERTTNPKTGKEQTVFIYDQVVVRAPFLEAMQMPSPWLKLWRDAVWSTLKGIPKTRLPYEERSEGRDASVGRNEWAALNRFARDAEKGRVRTEEVAGSTFLGAMAHNAERVPFTGRVDENFLLHFWPAVTLVYQPEKLVYQRKKGVPEEKFSGYVFAIPDVSDIEGFAAVLPEVIASLRPELAGFRPRDSIVTVPHEGALEYGRHLAAIAAARAASAQTEFAVGGFELHHVEKQGNNIHVHSSDRVGVNRIVLDRYEAIRGAYHDPWFRRQRILNLLRGRPWFAGFERLFASAPQEAFIGPSGRRFAADASRRFREVLQTGGTDVGDQNVG